jgi:hypothetical protein
MSYVRISSIPQHPDEATFRDWGKKLSDAMEAVGFTKTADTGQVDWAAVAKPTAINTYTGYEIRQFTDTLQATVPVFVKIEYGNGSYAVGKPGLRITVGRGSDGAGALTGDVAGYFYLTCSGSTETASVPSYVSSDGGRINLGLWLVNAGSSANAFWIERLKNDDGSPNANGIHIFSSTNTATRSMVASAQVLPASAGAAYPAAPGKPCCAIPTAGNMTTYNENIGLFPVHPNLGYAGNPDLGGLVTTIGEMFAPGAFMTVNILGANHNYVYVKNLNMNIAGNSSCDILVRCE